MNNKHYSVLLNECIQALNLSANGVYVDATLGLGGHAAAILKLIPEGKLFGFDKDEFAIEESRKRLSEIGSNFELIHSDFCWLKTKLATFKIESVDGIVADLGVSSPQLDLGERGFSYSKDARLDMRMDTSQTLDAHFVVNNYTEDELANVLHNYGEVKFARSLARRIVTSRPINTTLELANIVRSALPAAVVSKKNPNKAVFQAIRIEVNDELNSLRSFLEQGVSLLKVGASLAIISFHSLEDVMIKQFFGNLTKPKHHPKLPIQEDPNFKVKVIRVSAAELAENNRSRSAKLRVLTRLK
ncbi:16S rRNA (cytosine(1402)-N(4))-methyltransferase RsmH [Mycoplasmopsis columbinasalis]|uniref:Ribosomal RNA small subunit methyltransferase H n=1 Tax=Mycoplasmopsis columbinasalis TaxID=114880 RepID=A0A449BB27_9BACT|nr:16S rRNA (cytosine(1402)-N(4))-methyltransferase RsmH [Mycoplasmopsis columbinasalis]VEU78406.1 S-adenosyl-methyltransferase MraW [Mycoplasmopsis columbinasalis]